MGQAASREASRTLTDYIILWLQSCSEAYDRISDASSFFHLGMVNAALDAREKLLLWIDAPSAAPTPLIEASVARPAGLRLVKGGRYFDEAANSQAADGLRVLVPSQLSAQASQSAAPEIEEADQGWPLALSEPRVLRTAMTASLDHSLAAVAEAEQSLAGPIEDDPRAVADSVAPEALSDAQQPAPRRVSVCENGAGRNGRYSGNRQARVSAPDQATERIWAYIRAAKAVRGMSHDRA